MCCRYYKRLDMPEMALLQLVGEPSRLSWQHTAGTLTVFYSKPPALIAEVSCEEVVCVCVCVGGVFSM